MNSRCRQWRTWCCSVRMEWISLSSRAFQRMSTSTFKSRIQHSTRSCWGLLGLTPESWGANGKLYGICRLAQLPSFANLSKHVGKFSWIWINPISTFCIKMHVESHGNYEEIHVNVPKQDCSNDRCAVPPLVSLLQSFVSLACCLRLSLSR